MSPLYYTSKWLQPYKHGFFSRQGGTSTGNFRSLNFGINGDDRKNNVDNNRRFALDALGLNDAQIIFMKQVHSNHVQLVQTRPVKPLEADGMVTDKPGLVLGILTADCQPIILTDPVTKIVAAVHAGWKGTLNGIIHNTLSIMMSLGAAKENIRGAIGPSISQDHYEFGGDLREKFIQRYSYASQYFRPIQNDRFYFDLTGITLNIFAEAGIHKIERLDLCTYANEGLFFSYRRSCHHHENQFGLNGSIIAT